MLRDQSLAVSGLLARHVGGASVKPYQPEGLWEEKTGGNRYDQGHGDDLHRRSLYTYFKRTIPHPAMSVFDAADRNNCSVRRQSTSTPLQPLALLNDIQAVEAARFLAGRMLSQGGESLSKQLIFGFRTVTSRPPSARELRVLEMLFEHQKKIFQSDPLAAARFLSVGESVVDGVENPIDLAAATIVAKTLLNHDEAILRR